MQDFVRKLTHRDGREVEVFVGIPIQEGPNGDWKCSYRICGIGSPRLKISMGGDGIQAFLLALIYVATTLYCSEEFENGELTWDGGMTISDLGFPVADTIREEIEAKKARVEQILRTAR
jgi:hypothetical protein